MGVIKIDRKPKPPPQPDSHDPDAYEYDSDSDSCSTGGEEGYESPTPYKLPVKRLFSHVVVEADEEEIEIAPSPPRKPLKRNVPAAPSKKVKMSTEIKLSLHKRIRKYAIARRCP